MTEIRTLETRDATLIGLGAIVGGGILALGGHALARVGPAAIAVFAINGIVALLTAGAFAELAARFPVSGGAYAYARKIVSVRAAFAVGWILWFAYIVAGVLYAIGFGVFGAALLRELQGLSGGPMPAWLASSSLAPGLGFLAIVGYGLQLSRSGTRGGQGATWGKLVVFALLIALGALALPSLGSAHLVASLDGVATAPPGLFVATMGLTFVALQGFDAIATVAHRVKDPGRALPRAMLGSVALALAVYLPLLAVTVVAGPAEGTTIQQLARNEPDTVMAAAARGYAGAAGWWLVATAAVLAMASALQANLIAASQVARSMAADRTLPRSLGAVDPDRGTPTTALLATALAMIVILAIVPDLESAGAAASLIFLLTFAGVNGLAVLARRRLPSESGAFLMALFPVPHVFAGVVCTLLLISQLLTEPGATAVTALWLALGVLLYSAVFAGRAEAMDAFAEGHDPHLLSARGRTSLILVPVANPDQAGPLTELAGVVSPPGAGEVLLLSVVRKRTEEALLQGQDVLRRALLRTIQTDPPPQALTVFGADPAKQILRTARQHRCSALVVGLSKLGDGAGGPLERVIEGARTDLVVLRAPLGFRVSEARRILVPVGGRAAHDELRARLLGSLQRTGEREVTFLRVLPPEASADDEEAARRQLRHIATDEAPGRATIEVVRSDSFPAVLAARSAETDLLVLGMLRIGRRGRGFGRQVLDAASGTDCAAVFIGRRV
ncbi:MAG: amino acid permease [Proteobacteria bacterium]|nr:amino acid permease [Pseudomonadota bacterium]